MGVFITSICVFRFRLYLVLKLSSMVLVLLFFAMYILFDRVYSSFFSFSWFMSFSISFKLFI